MWFQNLSSEICGTATRKPDGTRHLQPSNCLDALPAINTANCTHAWLALAGDKHALLEPTGHGLLLYARCHRYAIALCEATGTRSGRESATRSFFDYCNQLALKPVFYQADSAAAQELRQRGMQCYALGEEARIALTQFSLEGSARKSIRQNVRKLEREGVFFELVAKPDARLIGQCLDVSANWLAGRRSSEKRFSLGQATVEYLSSMPIALVWHQDKLVAFANILQTADHSVLSVDLMRHLDDAPGGCMDFLFARLMEWGRTQGYAYFSMGMAPLTGEAVTSGSRNWPHLAKVIRRFGERYYGFSGLRRYKQKWQPEWQARYLVVPRRRDLLSALLECAVTIAGGKRALLGYRKPAKNS